MKKNEKVKRKKGFGPILALLIAAMVILFAAFFISVVPPLWVRRHLVQTIVFEYNYNNAQLALNTLLSVTKIDTTDNQEKSVSKIIARYVEIPTGKPDISFLDAELDMMVDNGIFECYRLTSGKAGLLSENIINCEPEKYKAFAFISTPDGSDKLELIIDWRWS